MMSEKEKIKFNPADRSVETVISVGKNGMFHKIQWINEEAPTPAMEYIMPEPRVAMAGPEPMPIDLLKYDRGMKVTALQDETFKSLTSHVMGLVEVVE